MFARSKGRAPLSINEIKHIHGLLKSAGLKRVTYLGGEPFLNKNILEAARDAKTKSLSTAVVTNGTAISFGVLEDIVNKKLFDVIIFSVDGPAKIHDFIRGVEGAFQKTSETIQQLQKFKKTKKAKHPKIYVYMTVSKLNYQYLEDMFLFAQKHDVSALRFISASAITGNIIKNTNEYFNSQRGADAAAISSHSYEIAEDLKVPTNAIASIAGKLQSFKTRAREIGIKLFAEELLLKEKGAASCDFLGNNFVISAYGDIYPCPMLPDYTIGNILRPEGMDILKRPDTEAKISELKELSNRRRLPVCRECCVEKLSF
jgi:radical SAM protein with 4Fe4S-binding SPASM domain